ncbi:MAG: hypothetical protein QOI80_3804, partial [Solirubrobacteraceae bacterium]|nr:hypothetical protein [Solirubrobacteraceae bacterium]
MIADATPWIDECLAAAGRERTGPVELFRERPWATVLKAPTTDGTVWFKAPSADTAFEVGLYGLLGRVAPEHVLVPLGVDRERSWLLLPDGGAPLLEQASGADRIAALEAVMPQYAELQRSVAPHVDELLAFGVADMRPAAMPARFDTAIAEIEGGQHVASARERFVAWCDELDAGVGGASIDHNDLHAENILPAPDGSVRFYDWGDSVVAHPFASMLVGLGAVIYTDKCPPDDARILRVRDAYLEAFTDLA